MITSLILKDYDEYLQTSLRKSKTAESLFPQILPNALDLILFNVQNHNLDQYQLTELTG